MTRNIVESMMARSAARLGAASALFCLVAAGGLEAQGGSPCAPIADGTEVIYSNTGTEVEPDVAVFASGRRILVWSAQGPIGNDSSNRKILAMFVGANGVPEGAPFQINSWTDGAQIQPAVAAAPDGRFVVVWESSTSPDDLDRTSIRGRLYNANGSPRAADFSINNHTPDDQIRPRAGMANDGSFVVVWESDTSPGNDNNATSIQARRYGNTGTPLGGQFQVNTRIQSFQQDPAVASAPDGSFVVVFASRDSAGTDPDDSIQARRFSPTGQALGVENQVNVQTASTQVEPEVAIDPDGSYLVVWQSSTSAGSDNSGTSIQARGFLANGSAAGNQVQVNARIDGTDARPDVGAVGGREFLVAWESPITGVTYPETRARALTLESQVLGFEYTVSISSQRPAVDGNGKGASSVVTTAVARTDAHIVGQTYTHPCATGGGIFACTQGPTTLCLNRDRFRVTANWRTAQGTSGSGQAIELTPNTGYFWFFDAGNVELVVKVLDACGFNDRYWVFAAGLSDVDIDLIVEDTLRGETRNYTSPVNVAFAPVTDTDAFATCP